MRRDTVLDIIQAHQPELEELGVVSVSLFGSVARNEATEDSDIDVAVRLVTGPHGFAYFDRLDRIESRLRELLGRQVDVVPEPAPAARIQRAIDQDRYLAF
jgi:predicted nucleotidyltransferase